MANLQTIGPYIESQPLNNNFAALNNNKLEKSGDTMTGNFYVEVPVDGGYSQIVLKNHTQILDTGAYWEAGVDQFCQIQSWDTAAGAPSALRINPFGGQVRVNGYEVWHGGNNPANVAASGYHKLASGFIWQWGSADIPPAGGGITFPIAFPNALAGVFPVVVDTDPHLVSIYNPTLIGCGILHDSGSTKTVYWFAVGW